MGKSVFIVKEISQKKPVRSGRLFSDFQKGLCRDKRIFQGSVAGFTAGFIYAEDEASVYCGKAFESNAVQPSACEGNVCFGAVESIRAGGGSPGFIGKAVIGIVCEFDDIFGVIIRVGGRSCRVLIDNKSGSRSNFHFLSFPATGAGFEQIFFAGIRAFFLTTCCQDKNEHDQKKRDSVFHKRGK
jgi:hypothetical protein